MALLKTTPEAYYHASQTFIGDNSTKDFELKSTNFDPIPTEKGEFTIKVNNVIINDANYNYPKTGTTNTIEFTGNSLNTDELNSSGAPKTGLSIVVKLNASEKHLGNYQNIKIKDLINNFIISYVGEGKIIPKVKRTDVAFHAQRALQELSYDTFRSVKSQEIEVGPSLTMTLPHDYVNYVKVVQVDSCGIGLPLYPARHTANPNAILQDSDFNYIFDSTTGEVFTADNSETWERYKSETASERKKDKEYFEELGEANEGGRYGMEPEHAQDNGIFFIDQLRGKIHVSSHVSGKVIALYYISDGLSVDGEMQAHKFAEEAVYKYIAHAILSTRLNVPEYIINRFKKERFAEIRKAKLRLSNLKTEELAQIMRGKSKVIKS